MPVCPSRLVREMNPSLLSVLRQVSRRNFSPTRLHRPAALASPSWLPCCRCHLLTTELNCHCLCLQSRTSTSHILCCRTAVVLQLSQQVLERSCSPTAPHAIVLQPSLGSCPSPQAAASLPLPNLQPSFLTPLPPGRSRMRPARHLCPRCTQTPRCPPYSYLPPALSAGPSTD